MKKSHEPQRCSSDLEAFTVEQGQCWVTVLGFLPLPAVLLQEEGRVFLELVQLPEGVVQGEGKSLSLLRQGRVGLTERQAGVGVRQGGAG